MTFAKYTLKEKYKELDESQIKETIDNLTKELEGLSKGDKKVVENEIKALYSALQIIEDTVSADIANVQNNLMASCSNKADCKCSKCNLLRREPTEMKVIETLSFGNFFGK